MRGHALQCNNQFCSKLYGNAIKLFTVHWVLWHIKLSSWEDALKLQATEQKRDKKDASNTIMGNCGYAQWHEWGQLDAHATMLQIDILYLLTRLRVWEWAREKGHTLVISLNLNKLILYKTVSFNEKFLCKQQKFYRSKWRVQGQNLQKQNVKSRRRILARNYFLQGALGSHFYDFMNFLLCKFCPSAPIDSTKS